MPAPPPTSVPVASSSSADASEASVVSHLLLPGWRLAAFADAQQRAAAAAAAAAPAGRGGGGSSSSSSHLARLALSTEGVVSFPVPGRLLQHRVPRDAADASLAASARPVTQQQLGGLLGDRAKRVEALLRLLLQVQRRQPAATAAAAPTVNPACLARSEAAAPSTQQLSDLLHDLRDALGFLPDAALGLTADGEVTAVAGDGTAHQDATAVAEEFITTYRGGDASLDPSLSNFSGVASSTVVGVPSCFAGGAACVLFQPADYVSREDRSCKRALPALPAPLRRAGGDNYGVAPHAVRVYKKAGNREGVWARIGDGCVRFGVILATLQRAGVRLCGGPTKADLYWAKRVTPAEYKKARRGQRINHLPGMWAIGRKDLLARGVDAMRRRHGEAAFGFHPESYVMPGDALKLQKRLQQQQRGGGETFIVKPCARACGQGIFLVTAESIAAAAPGSAEASFTTSSCVAQRYVPDPFLINGLKVDFRCYVVVTGVDPLRIFMYKEGMVRFATEPFPGPSADVGNRFAHLTNYSVNKLNEGRYAAGTAAAPCAGAADGDADGGGGGGGSDGDEDEDEDDGGESGGASKWTLTQFRRHCEERGLCYPSILAQFYDVAVKTVLTQEAAVFGNTRTQVASGGQPCFEIYGFDFLLDSSLKVHLIEVNIMPSLNASVSPLDEQIKCNFVADLLTLVGLQVPAAAASAAAGSTGAAPPALSSALARRTSAAAAKASYVPAGGGGGASSAAATASALYASLAAADRRVVEAAEDEHVRRGNFARIFPTAHTYPVYRPLFEAPRRSNELLHRWERAKAAEWEEVFGEQLPEGVWLPQAEAS